MITERTSKYKIAVLEALGRFGHATNAMLAQELRKSYPTLSDTTVHRVTARLHETGTIAIAPPASDGAIRYDITTSPHDHFLCSGCDGIRNLDVAESLIPRIETALGGCKITGRLTINGSCERCMKGSK